MHFYKALLFFWESAETQPTQSKQCKTSNSGAAMGHDIQDRLHTLLGLILL